MNYKQVVDETIARAIRYEVFGETKILTLHKDATNTIIYKGSELIGEFRLLKILGLMDVKISPNAYYRKLTKGYVTSANLVDVLDSNYIYNENSNFLKTLASSTNTYIIMKLDGAMYEDEYRNFAKYIEVSLNDGETYIIKLPIYFGNNNVPFQKLDKLDMIKGGDDTAYKVRVFIQKEINELLNNTINTPKNAYHFREVVLKGVVR